MRWYSNFWTTLIVFSYAFITRCPGIFDFLTLLKLTPNVANNILRNPCYCSFAPILYVFVTSFINKPAYSRDLTIFMISFISSFKIISVVIPDSNILSWTAASVDATTVNI